MISFSVWVKFTCFITMLNEALYWRAKDAIIHLI